MSRETLNRALPHAQTLEKALDTPEAQATAKSLLQKMRNQRLPQDPVERKPTDPLPADDLAPPVRRRMSLA